MTKTKPIQISIPHPCTQNWDEMMPDGQGRHCVLCQKTVIDFTSWTDTALHDYLTKAKGNICGRFLDTQLNRPIQIPHQPQSRLYRMTIALGLTLLFTQTPDLLAQARPPIITQTADTIRKSAPADGVAHPGSLTGTAVDDKKEALISATIQIFQDGVLKGGAITDYDGFYKIDSLEPGTYKVVALYYGYDSATVTVTIASKKETQLDLQLVKSKSCLVGLLGIITTNYRVPLIDRDNPTKRTLTDNQINHMPR